MKHTTCFALRTTAALVAITSCIASLFGAENAGKKYAVETLGGVPTITIDGVPTRARMFFGRAGASPILATNEWRTFESEFVAEDDAKGDGTIHFRFGADPGVVNIDNFSIVEKETGKVVAGPYGFENESDFTDHWTTFHSVFNNRQIGSVAVQKGAGMDNSNALSVKLFEFPKDWLPDFHLYHNRDLSFKKGVAYVVKFDFRSDKSRCFFVNIYRPADPAYIKIGSCGQRSAFESQVKLAAGAGVNFVTFLPAIHAWPNDDGTYNWASLDALCDAALKNNPNALLIPRFKLDASISWLDKHPNAKEVWEKHGADHDGQGWDWAAPVSKEYREAACQTLTALIRHLESKYGDSVAGYHPAGQNTSEWFTPNTWTKGYPGFSVADRDAFRVWLREKYQSDEALQKAWGDANVTLDSAVVPSAEVRDASLAKPLVESRQLLDFNEYWQSTMTGAIIELARTIKKETNGRKLSVFFYGYSYEFSTVAKGPAASAHYALKDLLACPDVDIICSPMSYSERQLGGGGSCMLNAESVELAGKMYLYEDDSRTFLAHAVGADLASTTTLKDSVNVLLRNSGECAIRNFGTWLMDLGATGWYDSPELWQASASLAKMDEYFLNNPTPYKPEVGLFLSEASLLKISSGQYSGRVSSLRRDFNLLSAPYAQYDLDDLLAGKIAAPKLSVILNPIALDDQTRAKIEERAKETGARVLYINSDDKITTHELRKIAAEAGVWCYTDLWCNVWANGPYVLLHAPADGDYKFHAPEGKNVFDYFTDKRLSDDGELVLKMKMGDTKILRLE